MNRHSLDARRLLCPMPVIRTQNLVNTLPASDIVEVVCTDPGVLHDIPAWCRINGHRVLDTHKTDGDIIITIQIGVER